MKFLHIFFIVISLVSIAHPEIDVDKLYCRGFTSNEEGGIWVTDGQKLYIFSGGSFLELPIFNSKSIYSIQATKKNGVLAFLAGDAGISLYKAGKKDFELLCGNKLNPNVLFEDKTGRLWLADYENNIITIMNGQKEKTAIEYGFFFKTGDYQKTAAAGNFNPLSFYEDTSGRVWCWTNSIFSHPSFLSFLGLKCFKDGKEICVKAPDLKNGRLNGFFEFEPGKFLAGLEIPGVKIGAYKVFELGGCVLFDDIPLITELASSWKLHSSVKDAGGRTWFVAGKSEKGTKFNNNLYRVEKDGFVRVLEGIDWDRSSVYNSTRLMYAGKDGSLWIEAMKRGLYRVDKEGKVDFFGAADGLFIDHVGGFARVQDGIFLVAPKKDRSEYRFCQILGSAGKKNNSKLSGEVYTQSPVLEDGDGGLVWVDPDNALLRYKDGKILKVAEVEPGRILGFAVDSKKRIWILQLSKGRDISAAVFGTGAPRFGNAPDLFAELLSKDPAVSLKYDSTCAGLDEAFEYPVVTPKGEIYYMTRYATDKINYYDGTKWSIIDSADFIIKTNRKLTKPFVTPSGKIAVNLYGATEDNEQKSYFLKGPEMEKADKYYSSEIETAVLKRRQAAEKSEYLRELGHSVSLRINKENRKIWVQKEDRAEIAGKFTGGSGWDEYHILEASDGTVFLRLKDVYTKKSWLKINIREFFDGAPEELLFSSAVCKGVETVLKGKKDNLDSPVEGEELQFYFSDSAVFIDEEHLYRIDGKAWQSVAPGKNKIAVILENGGRHFIEIKRSGDGNKYAVRLGFEANFNVKDIIEAHYNKLLEGNTADRVAEEHWFAKRGAAAYGYLQEKLKKTDSEKERWIIEAIISKISFSGKPEFR